MSDDGLIRLSGKNLAGEHICCAIGEDAENRSRAAAKKAWLAERLPEGHSFLKADLRGKAFIEYGPAELAWFPIEAPSWLFAQCFWVAGRFAGTGIGSRLLEAAERDAGKAAGLCFLAAAKGKKPFLSDGKYLRAKGYELVDEALGFGLFAKAARKGAAAPRFCGGAREGRLSRATKGVDLFWSPQCPFAPSVAASMAAAAEAAGFGARLHEVESAEAARRLCAPPGIFQAYLDGSFLTHELMTDAKFSALLTSRRP